MNSSRWVDFRYYSCRAGTGWIFGSGSWLSSSFWSTSYGWRTLATESWPSLTITSPSPSLWTLSSRFANGSRWEMECRSSKNYWSLGALPIRRGLVPSNTSLIWSCGTLPPWMKYQWVVHRCIEAATPSEVLDQCLLWTVSRAKRGALDVWGIPKEALIYMPQR